MPSSKDKEIETRITLVSGNWGLGSVILRFDNYPVDYDGKKGDLDLAIILMEPIDRERALSEGYVRLQGATFQVDDVSSLEKWIQKEVCQAWNENN